MKTNYTNNEVNEMMVNGYGIGMKGAEDLEAVDVVADIANVRTVDTTTEGALGVTKVSVGGTNYTIGADWTYQKVQNVLAQLGVTIPNAGTINNDTLSFPTTTPQNYGTKGFEDEDDEDFIDDYFDEGTEDEDAETEVDATVNIANIHTVDTTTEGALGVTKVSVGGTNYTIGADWTYQKVQNVLAQLGVTIPNSGTINDDTLSFPTTTPQNYGTKGSEDETEVDATVNIADIHTVDTTTEGALGVTKVSVGGTNYTIGADWTYQKVQNVLAQLGVTIPNAGTINNDTLSFPTTTPQNYGTKGNEDGTVTAVNIADAHTVDSTTEGALGVTKVSVGGTSYAIGTDWTYQKVQNVLAQLGVTIPNTGVINNNTLSFPTATPQNYGTKGSEDETEVDATVNIADVRTVDSTTEGALGVTKVSVGNTSYAIGADWTYQKVQNVLAQLGVTIPNTGAINNDTLSFPTTTPQNYGTKGTNV